MVINSVTAENYTLSPWLIVNDTVMGGESNSQIGMQRKYLVFSGLLSLENNGGFASARALISRAPANKVKRVSLYVVGDGRTYQLRFRTNRGFDGMAYSSSFSTIKDKLTFVEFKESDFKASFRGYHVIDAPDFLFADVQQIGIMIADKKPGPFELKISSLAFN